MVRLLLFALISQIPYVYAFNEVGLNVFFSLFLALFGIYVYEKTNNILSIIIAAALTQLQNSDWGFYGILLVFVFHKYKGDFSDILRYVISLTVIFDLLSILIYTTNSISIVNTVIHPVSLLSLILIKLYNNKRGRRFKYVFYAFYPLHLLLILLARDYLI